MIEFKADCGHTVRAKDEDAGKVVRCAYCGREAQVPQDDQDELDFLFSDPDATSHETPAGSAHGPGRQVARPRTPYIAARTRVDPFAVVKKMSYVAAILICVIFVGKKYAWPMFQEAFLEEGPSASKPVVAVRPPTRQPPANVRPVRPKPRYGFLTVRLDSQPKKQGVYVNSVPTDATAYYCKAEGRDRSGFDWIRDADVDAERVETPCAIGLEAGKYVFVVMVPVNDRALKQRYRKFGYDDFRREIESSPRHADAAARTYFRPDEATDVKILRTSGRVNVARRYVVVVDRGSWSVLTPQFLPYNCRIKDITQFVPKTRAYGFDEEELLDDFEFYGVRPEDRDFMVDILHSIGTISYRELDASFRMFKIDPFDGMISAPRLEGEQRAAPQTERT